MAKGTTGSRYVRKNKSKRPNIHAKTKQSKNKNSKNYVKINVGQGR